MGESDTSYTRDRKVAEIIDGFLSSVVLFKKLYARFQRGALRFSDIEQLVDDRGKSLLFNLKESSHILVREKGESTALGKEQLFDLALGSLFHGAMKLREDLYQKEVYGPRVARLAKEEDLSKAEGDLVASFKKIIDRVEDRIRAQMEETRTLFDETTAEARDLLKNYAANGLLIRFLLSHESLVDEVFGAGELRRICADLYPKGLAGAQIEAGKSYLRSAHFEKATDCFRRASEALPSDTDLAFFVNYTAGMNSFYESDYKPALARFGEAVDAAKGTETAPFLMRLPDLLKRLTEDLAEGLDR
ncbi:MAG: hypothetical protein ACRD1Z_17790, partial [Vicinamibacteria bacterium]